MPATATGRGAQVVLDPLSDHARAARGAYAATLELNLQKRRDDVVAGTSADGYAPDGRTNTGSRATDEVTTPGGGVNRILNPPVVPVGNGADTTVDTLQNFIIPAGTLRAVGDRIRGVAGGTYIGSTDNKFAQMRLGPAGTAYATTNTGATAAIVAWRLELEVIKTGANAQVTIGLGTSHAAMSNVSSNVIALNDTLAMAISVSGQNATNPVANSIVCNYLSVEYLPTAN